MALSDQVPTSSPYGAKTDGADVIADLDLSGKTAVVTGGYSGLGLETVRALAAKGARVIVPVRSPKTAAENLAGIGRYQTDFVAAAEGTSEAGGPTFWERYREVFDREAYRSAIYRILHLGAASARAPDVKP